MSLGGSIMASLTNIMFDYNYVINLWDAYITLLITVLGALLHGSYVYVFQLESSAVVAGVIGNLGILWGFLFDIFLFGVSLDIYNLLGCVVVAVCGILIAME